MGKPKFQIKSQIGEVFPIKYLLFQVIALQIHSQFGKFPILCVLNTVLNLQGVMNPQYGK